MTQKNINKKRTWIPSSRIIRKMTRNGVKSRRLETCILAFARMRGYVIVDAMLFATAPNKKVSRGEWRLDWDEFLNDNEFGGNVDLNNSKR